ncbi:hypothetical protein FRB99_002750 [Tulasnella sp. 403]|nr:hypothetical protein FRB99_002750 [Tulasnella sp. 403]
MHTKRAKSVTPGPPVRSKLPLGSKSARTVSVTAAPNPPFLHTNKEAAVKETWLFHDSILSPVANAPASTLPLPRQPLAHVLNNPTRNALTALNVLPNPELYDPDKYMLPSPAPARSRNSPPSPILLPRANQTASSRLPENKPLPYALHKRRGTLASSVLKVDASTSSARRASAIGLSYQLGPSQLNIRRRKSDYPAIPRLQELQSSPTPSGGNRTVRQLVLAHESSFYANRPRATSTPGVQINRLIKLARSAHENIDDRGRYADQGENSPKSIKRPGVLSEQAMQGSQDDPSIHYGPLLPPSLQDSILSPFAHPALDHSETTMPNDSLLSRVSPTHADASKDSGVPNLTEQDDSRDGNIAQPNHVPELMVPSEAKEDAMARISQDGPQIPSGEEVVEEDRISPSQLSPRQPQTSIRVRYKRPPVRRKGQRVALSDLDPKQVWMRILDEPLLPDSDDSDTDPLLLVQKDR